MAEPLIEVKGLYKVFGKRADKVITRATNGDSKDDILRETGHTLGLRNINLTINRGEVFVIMGLSGSGKSTLIRHFNRLIDPTQGQILIEGEDIMKLSQSALEKFRQKKMSMVFQRFALFAHKNVIENIAYGLEVQRVNKTVRIQKAMQWLHTVGLDGYEKQYPSQLSGGQQQRVGLARALCTDAEILLMDEAFSALDPLIRGEMQTQLIQLQQQLNKTIIFITHDLDEALRIGNKIAILKDGELVQQGTPEQILLYPANDYVEAFVKDVNRARALTVETVMQPPAHRIAATTIAEALDNMRYHKREYAYHVTDNGYQGMLTQAGLHQAAKKSQHNITDELYEKVPVFTTASPIESVLSQSLTSDYSLPVIDKDGELKGEIERSHFAEFFEHKESAPAKEKITIC